MPDFNENTRFQMQSPSREPMGELEYHLAGHGDIQILIDFRVRFAIEYSGILPTELENELRRNLQSYFSMALNQSYYCWYATANGKPIAVAGLVERMQPGNAKNPTGRWGYVLGVYTYPEFRRMGVASQILDRLLETGKEKGIVAFELHATPFGESVYLKAGFEYFDEPTLRKYL